MTLAADALEFGFRAGTVGRGVALSLAGGEVVCLLGPNGSGKTTLLRTLLGLLPPLAGRVLLDGREVGAWSGAERARRVAYVPQTAESHFDFSVRETVEMGRTAHRGVFTRPDARDHERAAEALSRVGIAALAERPIRRLSGGERQLAHIARALATEAAYLLMDEPTANLDFGNQGLVLDEIARLRAAGRGVLFSTHHPEQALRMADRVVMLRDGGVLAAGGTSETVTSANLSALYGRPVEVVEVACGDGRRRQTCIARDAGPFP